MKKVRSLFAVLSLLLIMVSSSMVVFATGNEAVADYANTEDVSKREVIDQSFFIIDQEGNCKEVSEAQTAAYIPDDAVEVAFTFYDMGVDSEGKQSYEVEMTAKCLDTDIYFTHTTLYAKPENNTDWFKSPIKHEAYLKKKTVGDSIYYTYPGAGPSTPTVEVKATLTFNQGSYSIPKHTLSNPK